MFDKEKVEKEILKNRAKMAAKRELMDMLTKAMLASDMPENAKTSLRLITASSDLEALIHDAATEATLCDDNLNVENAKKYLLMIIACRNQIKAFLESNPLITNTEEENREANER